MIQQVTAGWDAVPGEWTPRDARKANRDWRAFVSECLHPVEGGDRWWDWRRWEECGQDLGDLESKIPVEWMAAARAGGSASEPLDAIPSEEQTSKMLVARMGWETREGIRFTVGEYSVRLGTALQHDQVRQRRAEAHKLLVADAVGRAPNSPVVSEEVQRLIETLPRLWQEIKWENTHKEAYWRLTVDGISHAGHLAHAAGGGGAVWVRGEARPRRIA
jgi:hypothetical protein